MNFRELAYSKLVLIGTFIANARALKIRDGFTPKKDTESLREQFRAVTQDPKREMIIIVREKRDFSSLTMVGVCNGDFLSDDEIRAVLREVAGREDCADHERLVEATETPLRLPETAPAAQVSGHKTGPGGVFGKNDGMDR